MVKSVSEKVKSKDIPFASISYVLGIVALVEAFVSPAAGLVLSIIGLVFSKKDNSNLSLLGKRLNMIALIVSVVFLILAIVLYFVDLSAVAGTVGQ